MDYKGVEAPPPYQQMPPPPPSTPHVTVITPQIMFREYPVQVTCGNCCENVITTVEKANGTCAYATAGAVCLVCFPFFWLPLVLDACKDYHHFCPSCNALLGVYKKI